MQSVRCLAGAALARPTSGLRPAGRRGRVVTRVFEEVDGPGVQSLLERDLRKAELKEDELLAAFSEDPAAAESSSSSSGPPPPRQAEQQRGPASKRADKLRAESNTPERAREAIDLGLKKFQAREYQAAIDLFQLSLELPGSGVMRLSGSVREYSCPSEGEENAALYNMACCWAALGQKESALTVLEALLENNFEDYAAIRSDPDLASLRGPQLDKLLGKYDGLMSRLFGGSRKQQSSNKPWLQW